MWRSLKILYNRVPEPFTTLQPASLRGDLKHSLMSNIYYTPKLQKLPFTPSLTEYISYLNRKDKIKVNDMRSLVEAILTEYGAIHGLEQSENFKGKVEYTINRNYLFKQNQLSPYFGHVDYMVFLNDTHFVPVLFCDKQINPVAGFAMAHATRGLKCLATNNLKNSGYSIVTTGQQWQMFKIYSSMKAEKTVIYEGRNRFKNILQDFEMIQTVMGLIDQCL